MKTNTDKNKEKTNTYSKSKDNKPNKKTATNNQW